MPSQNSGPLDTDFDGVYAKGVNLTTAFPSKKVTSAKFHLKTTGSPTATITCVLVNSSGTSLGTLGTLDSSTLTSSMVEYEFIPTTDVETDTSSCSIMLVVPSNGSIIKMAYANSSTASSTDYALVYMLTSSSSPTASSDAYTQFQATVGAASGDSLLLPPPVAWI